MKYYLPSHEERKDRVKWPVRLFVEGEYTRCIADCRTLLAHVPMLPWHHVRCRVLIVASLDDWDEAEVR